MTTRTLLITVPGSDDPESCGECPFLEASWHMGAPDGEVCTLSGRTVTPVSAGLRHAACLAAERAAKAANDAMVLAAIRAGRTLPFQADSAVDLAPRNWGESGFSDESKARAIGPHIAEYVTAALERMDAEAVKKPPAV